MALLDQLPSPDSRSGALQRISAALGDLAPAELRIAQRLLSEPERAIALSISEFAELCGVAQPTVSRFCKTLGFTGYPALRLGIAHDFAAGTSAPSSEGDTLSALASQLRTDAALPAVARSLRHASQVEVWPAPDLSSAGLLLATELSERSILAACAPSPTHWPRRAAGLRPGAVVVLLVYGSNGLSWDHAVDTARAAGAQIICMAARPAKRLINIVDELLLLPAAASPELTGVVLADAVGHAVSAISDRAGPAGPASPWRRWPHSRPVFLPTDDDPIPAILLSQPESARPRSLVIFYGGFGADKAQCAPPGIAGDRVSPSMVAALLNAGHDVLAVEAPGHGERKRAWQAPVELLQASLRGDGPDLLAMSRAQAPALVDGALGLGVIDDPKRLAVVGQSWGGLQVLLNLAGDPRIACGVAIMPVCDVAELAAFTDLRGAPRYLSGNPSPELGSHLAPRPLLLISGGKDLIASHRHITAFADGIEPAYHAAGAPANLRHDVLDGVGHVFDTRQVDAMLEWLGQHLPAGPGPQRADAQRPPTRARSTTNRAGRAS